ncbi:MAG: phytanoyl-CoA dioxygenase family protein [Acidobacteriaceae bacterium]
MTEPNNHPQQLRALIRRFSLSEIDVEALCEKASSPKYWIRLNPHLGISSNSEVDWDSHASVGEKQFSEAVHSYRTLGFLALPALLSVSQIERMQTAVDNLRAADWPAVFSFVYDDFWLLGRATQLSTLLKEILHPQYRLLSRIWTHYVPNAVGNGGWVPHLDHIHDAGHTTSVWIPLTHATLRNGCMYLVKRSAGTEAVCRAFPNASQFSKEQVTALLKNCRALPADPGSVLCWDDKILHWGAQVEASETPRVSIALEFTVPDFVRAGDHELLLDPFSGLPSLETRLRLICNAVWTYRSVEPMMERFTPLVRRLAGKQAAQA